jgi:ankyrin repeat protein
MKTIFKMTVLVPSIFLFSVSLMAQNSLNEQLLAAAKRGDNAKATTLLVSGANIEAESDSEEETPLMIAAFEGKIEMVKFLLSKGAKIDAVNFNGNTEVGILAGTTYLLDEVAIEGLNMIKFLISEGAKINTKDDSGATPLILACWAGNDRIVRFLLASGANISDKDNADMGPLHWAALRNHPSTVKILLDKGAKCCEKDKDGETPYDIANKWGHYDVKSILNKN